jgi:hypothetical protein
MRKTRAFTDGTCHADGGEDLRHLYAGDHAEAYDLGYREHVDYLERQREYAERQEADPAAILRDLTDLDAAAEHAAEPLSSDLLALIRRAEAWLAAQ